MSMKGRISETFPIVFAEKLGIGQFDMINLVAWRFAVQLLPLFRAAMTLTLFNKQLNSIQNEVRKKKIKWTFHAKCATTKWQTRTNLDTSNCWPTRRTWTHLRTPHVLKSIDELSFKTKCGKKVTNWVYLRVVNAFCSRVWTNECTEWHVAHSPWWPTSEELCADQLFVCLGNCVQPKWNKPRQIPFVLDSSPNCSKPSLVCKWRVETIVGFVRLSPNWDLTRLVTWVPRRSSEAWDERRIRSKSPWLYSVASLSSTRPHVSHSRLFDANNLFLSFVFPCKPEPIVPTCIAN